MSTESYLSDQLDEARAEIEILRENCRSGLLAQRAAWDRVAELREEINALRMGTASDDIWSGRTVDIEFRGHRGFDVVPDAAGGHVALSEVDSLTAWMRGHADRQCRAMAGEASDRAIWMDKGPQS